MEVQIQDQTLIQPERIKLKVGGNNFSFKLTQLTAHQFTFLGKFAKMSHEQRLTCSDGYSSSKDRYNFDRPAKLFEPIYRFYITGSLHRPRDVCWQEFKRELDMWAVPASKLEKCCRMKEPKLGKTRMPLKGVFSTRDRWWRFCEGDGSCASAILHIVSVLIILISVSVLIIGTLPQVQEGQDFLLNLNASGRSIHAFYHLPNPNFGLRIVEYICFVWFTIEYLTRLALAPHKLKFAIRALNLIDLATLVPFYVELVLNMVSLDTELENLTAVILMLRTMRGLRVLRILKLSRYSHASQTFGAALRLSGRQLQMTMMVLGMSMLFFSTAIYYAEEGEPDTPFTSIPAAFWWCVVTMSTVGYGDVVPSTTFGKIVGTATIFSGVLVLALPISILVDKFTEVSERGKKTRNFLL